MEAAELRAAGYEPLEPYPGTVVAQWPARCITCGERRRPSLRDVRRGMRCAHRSVATSVEAAASEARAAGFEPLETYPGTRTASWRVRCTECAAERSTSLKAIRSGWQCKHRYPRITHVTSAEEATDEVREAGFEPRQPYPGKTKELWSVQCMACQSERTTTLNRIRSGERCMHAGKGKPVDRSPQGKVQRFSKMSSLPAPEIIDRYRGGESARRIAASYGTSETMIRRLLEEHGVDRRRRWTLGENGRRTRSHTAPHELPASKIATEYQRGASLADLARTYRVGPKRIVQSLEASGVQLRSSADVPWKGRSRVLTPEQEADVVRQHQSGQSQRAIARSLGVSPPVIRGILDRRERRRLAREDMTRGSGYAQLPDEQAPQRDEQMARRYEGGASLREIGVEFGVGTMTVRRRLLNRGVVMRPPGVYERPAKPKVRKRRQPPEQEIIRRYQDGATLVEVSQAVGFSVAVCRGVLVRNDIERRPRARRVLTGERREQALSLYWKGLPLAAVAEEFGVSEKAVRTVVLEAGAMRPSNQSRAIDDALVREIARRHKGDESIAALAREYGIARTTLQTRLNALRR